jgi:hydrogenase nickel incorporation protein HypA/HybF
MHEYSIVRSLLDRVEASVRGYDVSAVRALHVTVGALSGVDAGLLRTAYELCIPGTMCAGAELDVVEVPARWRCSRCGRDRADGERLTCAACGTPMTLDAGDEIVLEKIDLEVNDV